MKYTFEKKIPKNLLEEYTAHFGKRIAADVLRHNELLELFEETLLPSLNAREFIDLMKNGYLLLKEKKDQDETFYLRPRLLYRFKGIQKSCKLKDKNPNYDDKYFINFSKEEEIELIEFLLTVRWDFRNDYGDMDDVNSLIYSIFGYVIKYLNHADRYETDSETKESFIAKNMKNISFISSDFKSEQV